MLTADLVDVRRSGGELQLRKLDARKRARVRAIGADVLRVVREHEGLSRAAVEGALAAIDVGPAEIRLRDALAKLALDEASWTETDSERVEGVREVVFRRAAEARRAGKFHRAEILREAAAALGPEGEGAAPLDGDAVDALLFSDLREAQRMLRAPAWSPEALALVHEQARVQAVLLRATRIRVTMRCSSPHDARAVFRAIKFLGLLHTLRRLEGGVHLLEVDGPLSLFESVTKYGLKLALLVPVLEACEAYALEADVRWGKGRDAYVFRTSGGRGEASAPATDPGAELAASLSELGLRARVSAEIFELPGVGLCIPDVEVEREGRRAWVELLGFWSRAAVWKRVELVEAGLAPPIVFAVSSRLRVREDVLPEDAPSALYVCKGTISPRAVAAKLGQVLGR